MNTKNKKITNPLTPKAGKMALLSIFCAAAGVYAQSDGWSNNSGTIEYKGSGVTRTTSIEKGEKFSDNTSIGDVSKVTVSSGEASFKFNSADKGVVFNSTTNSLNIKEGAKLSVDASAKDGVNATGVEFSSTATSAKIEGLGNISVKASGDATAVSGTNVTSMVADTISAVSTSDTAKTTAINVSGNAGDIKVANITGDVKVAGTTGSFDVNGIAGNVSLGTVSGKTDIDSSTGGITIKDNKGVVTVGTSEGTLKIENANADVNVTTSVKALDVNLKGSNLDAEKVTGEAKVNGTGNATIGTAGSVKVSDTTGLTGNLTVETTVGKVDITKVVGNIDLKQNTGVVNVGTVDGKLTASDAKANINVITSAKDLDINLNSANLEAKKVTGEAKINGTGDAKLTASGSTSVVKIDSLTGGVNLTLENKATLDAEKVSGEVKVNGTGNATIGTAGSVKVDTTAGLDGKLVVETTVGKVNITKVTGDVNLKQNTGVVNVTTVGGELIASDAKANVNVKTSAGSLDVKLNGGNLDAEKVTGEAKVNGKGNATIATAGSIKIDSTAGLTGNLTVEKTVGAVNVTKVTGDVTIAQNTGVVSVNTVGGKLTVSDAKDDVKVNDSVNSLDIKLNDANLTAKNVTNGAVVNGDGDVDIEFVKTLTSEKLDGNITIDKNSGDITITDTLTGKLTASESKGNISVKNAGAIELAKGTTGNLNVTGTVGTIDSKGTITGNATLAQNTGAVSFETIKGKLTVEEAKGNVNVTSSVGSLDVELKDNVTLDAEKVTGEANVNGNGNATFGSAGSIKIDAATGLLGNLTVEKTVGALEATKVTGFVNIAQNTGAVNIDSVGTKLTLGDAKSNVTVGSAESVDAKLNGGDLAIETVDAEAKINGKGNAVLGTVDSVKIDSQDGLIGDLIVQNKVTSVDATKVSGNVNIAQNTGVVDIDSVGGKLTASDAQGNVNVNVSSGSLEVQLNNANLDAEKVAAEVKVNGTGDATLGSAGSVNIDSATGLTGNLTVENTVGKITATNVTGNANIAQNTGAITIDNVGGKLTASDAQADIKVGTAGSVQLDKGVVGNLEITQSAGSIVSTGTITGDVTIAQNKSAANFVTIGGKLTASDAQGDVNVSDSVASLDVNLNGGNLDAEKVTGEAKVNGTGNATVGTAGSIKIDSDAGLTGNLIVENTVGAVDATKVGGDVNIKQNTGVVTIDTIGGKLTASDAQGDINVTGSVDSVEATLNNGATLDAETVAGELKANGTGNVTVGTAGSVKIDSAEGLSGNLTVEKTVGVVDATKVSGNVVIAENTGVSEIDSVGGNLKVGLNGGDITVTGDVAVEAALSGKGIATLNTVGSLKAETTDGTFTMTAQQVTVNGGSLNVTATDVAGKVTLGDLAEANIDSGKADIKMGTVSGNVNVTGTGVNSLEVTLAGGVLTSNGTVINNANISGEGTVNATVNTLDNIDLGDQTAEIKDESGKKILSSTGKLTTNLTVETQNFAIKKAGDVNVETDIDKLQITESVASIDADGTTINSLVVDSEAKVTGSINVDNVGTMNLLGEVKDVTVSTATGDIKIVTADSLKFSNVVNLNVDKIDSIGRADDAIANNVSGDATIAQNTGLVDIDNVSGKLTASDVQGTVKVGTSTNLDVNLNGGTLDATTVSGEAKVNGVGTAVLGTVESLVSSDAQGTINVTGSANKVDVALNGGTLDVESAGEAKVNGTGNATFATADSIKVDSVDGLVGNLVVEKTVGAVEVTKVAGDINIAQNTGAVNVETVTGTLTASDAQGKIDVTTSANIVDVTLNGGELAAKTVTGDVTLNGQGNASIETLQGGNLTNTGTTANVNTAENDVTVNANAGSSSIFQTIKNKLTALLNGGTVVGNEVKEAEISGSGTAQIENLSGEGVVKTTDADKFVENGTGVATSGNLNVAINNSTDTVTFEKVNGGDIQGMSTIDNLNVTSNVGELNIGTSKDVFGNIVIADSSANINIGNVEKLDVTLSNDANLVAKEGTTVSDTARVNGGCDATYYNVNNLVVDNGLDGKLTVNGNVTTANVKNVTDGFSVANSNGTITIENTNLEVTNKINKVVANSDFVLTNDGSATLAGVIDASGHNITVSSKGFNVTADTNGAVIKADKINGSGAASLVHSFYSKKYGFTAEDNSLINTYTLVGTHDTSGSTSSKKGYIEASVGTLTASTKYIDVKYSNVANDGSKTDRVNYTITENSYLQDKIAKSENEKALAKVYDNLMFQNDAVKDQASVDKKLAFANAGSEGLKAALPQSVVHAARMNMDLGDMMHLDTIYRTSSTRDILNRYGKKLKKHVAGPGQVRRGLQSVSVRNINRFSSYSGDSNIDGSDDSIYGALANVEYIFNEKFFGGFGIGGFQSKSTGNNTSGKAESQSVAINIYGDYAFYRNFDWYFGLNYAFASNEAERNSLDENIKSDWDSNLLGIFTGVRYTWKPMANKPLYIKPMVGFNASFLMNPSFEENSKSEHLSVESEDYTSVKAIIGVEATYLFLEKFYLAGRLFYTHEFGDNSYDLNTSVVGVTTGANSLRVKGWEMDRDAAIIGIGLGYDIARHWNAYFDYSAEISEDVYHNLNIGVKYKF